MTNMTFQLTFSDEIGVEEVNQRNIFKSVNPAVTVKQIIFNVIDVLPTVTWKYQISITVWTIIVVFVLY